MAQFKTFIGKMECRDKDKASHPARLCDDVACRSFKEARGKALALYREKHAGATDLFAYVVCDDQSLLIASGIRPASVRNFGNGYCVDVTPSRA